MGGPYSMVGYYHVDSPRLFVMADVDADRAKTEAVERYFERYLLLPHRPHYQHPARIRVGPGKYEQMPTRLFVFTHLLSTGNDWIPTPDEVETGSRKCPVRRSLTGGGRQRPTKARVSDD